jgi:hypothetical protein
MEKKLLFFLNERHTFLILFEQSTRVFDLSPSLESQFTQAATSATRDDRKTIVPLLCAHALITTLTH